MQSKSVGVVLFENVEVLDFCGPFEVYSVTRLNEKRRQEEPSPFEVILVAESAGPITTVGGMRVTPDHTFESCPSLDILVVPGGRGYAKEVDNNVLLDWLSMRSVELETLTSVCTGSMLLARAGLLEGRYATTHWRVLDRMQESFPNVMVARDKHFVIDGNTFTSAGISAGIDMSLQVVALYCGEDVARATAKNMEYPYPEDDKRRIQI